MLAGTWTIIGDFRRTAGPGPLLESEDQSFQVGLDHDGHLASRVDGEIRLTDVPIDELADWTIFAVRHRPTTIELHVDGKIVDTWAPSTSAASRVHVFRNASGAVRELAIYDHAISDEDLAGTHVFLRSTRGAPYMEFADDGTQQHRDPRET